jgi:hypothetical protein
VVVQLRQQLLQQQAQDNSYLPRRFGMKSIKVVLAALLCGGTGLALAQNTTIPHCGATNYAGGNVYTIIRSTPTPNQQCLVEVRSKKTAKGAPPDFLTSQFVEGNYDVALAGGGGGGGGGGEEGCAVCVGQPGQDAIVSTSSVYLAPGIYKLTIGAGGLGGAGVSGGSGSPTNIATAAGITVAGFPGAEAFSTSLAGARGEGTKGAGGIGGENGKIGAAGAVGFIELTFVDKVSQSKQQGRARKKDRN